MARHNVLDSLCAVLCDCLDALGDQRVKGHD